MRVVSAEGLNRLLTYEELAEVLQVSPGTLRNWVSQEFIPFVKVGRVVRFDPETINRWIRKRSNPGRLSLRREV